MFPETWCIAYRKIENDDECLIFSTEKPFTVIPNTKNFWCADPFLFEKDGKLYAFFEVLDQIKRKGLLGCREINGFGYGDIKIIYECETHLSFPFIYENKDGIFITPESLHENKLFRLKCSKFPTEWEYDKTLIEQPLVDTVLFDNNETVYYVSQRVVNEGVFDRVDLFYEDNGEIKECNNPVKTDLSNARGAGKVFSYNNQYIRPVQDCSESYGGKLNFNRIINLSKNSFDEELLKTISAQDIKTNIAAEFCGIHTYNRLGNYEIIDLKLPARFSLRNTIGAIIKIIKGDKK